MRIVAISILALSLLPLAGCMTLHADVPPEVIRQHMAAEQGIELAAVCSYEGKDFSEGASTCMAERRMSCDPSGRWVQQDDGC